MHSLILGLLVGKEKKNKKIGEEVSNLVKENWSKLVAGYLPVARLTILDCLVFCFVFSAFSHKSPSGLYSACVTNACVRHMEFTEVVVVQSY